jgi:dTDP-4-dehydrorhamnose reductase
MLKSILVTGANGQLGSELRELSGLYSNYTFTFISRNELDFSNSEAVQTWFLDKSFDVIINCAAYTAVDKAESEQALAREINTTAVDTLARIAKEKDSSLIHISTDYVFDGRNFKPYSETDPTDPQGVYGQTKLDGEQAMLAINPAKSIIIRTSWVYSSFGNNFVKTMLRLGKEREELGSFTIRSARRHRQGIWHRQLCPLFNTRHLKPKKQRRSIISAMKGFAAGMSLQKRSLNFQLFIAMLNP